MSKILRKRVAVTGVGLVNPFGGNTDDYFCRLMKGESAVSLFHHTSTRMQISQPAVICRHFDPSNAIGKPLANSTDRYSQLGIAAAFSAWDDAGLPRKDSGSDDYGVSWGTGIGGAQTVEKGYSDFYEQGRDRASPMTVTLVMNNAAASHIALSLGLGGSCLTYSIACASSAVSVGEAFRRIQAGQSKLVVAGGSEAPMTMSIMRAWEAMRVISMGTEETAYRACRPFQSGRTGFVLGEGAAALILEDWDHAVERGARIYCELAGYGQSCDHSHIVRPDAKGQIRAINAALADADISPAEVGYVNAHGTATTEGDPIEINALKTVFGDLSVNLAVSSTKSMHGHLLGASGAMEALITVLAVARQEIPPTAHLEQVADDCQGVRHVMGEGLRNRTVHAALSNTFAFGGSNAVLVFRKS
jgi:3-oxoacyl-[acyl-carrier-protein] synthase II